MKLNNVQVMGALTLLAGTNLDLLDIFIGNKNRTEAADRLRQLTITALEYYKDHKPSDCFEDAGAVIATGLKNILNMSFDAPPDIVRDCILVMTASMEESAKGNVEGPKNA